MLIYAGNLPYRMTEDQLRETFEEFGQIQSCTLMKDKMTGRSKGFGFIEIPDDNQARAAIAGLNGKDFDGRKMDVHDAREKRP
ncbi:MAG TPA: RNA-binding protein [Blastocatellia bacterium]|nr:RNA-binding protein [Blastocatellia bacterium]